MNYTNKIRSTLSFAALFLCFSSVAQHTSDSVYFTTGFKMGEVTASSVVIWTRLCGSPKPVAVYHKQKEPPFKSPLNFDENMPISKMEGAVEGAFGEVKISLTANGLAIDSDWIYVSAYEDFTIKREFTGLQSNTTYSLLVQGRKDEGSPVTALTSFFTTAPAADDIVPVLFTSSTCQYYWSFDDAVRGFKIYDSMLKLHPAFHCQTGDYVYYDKPGPMATTIELARHKWHAMNSWPSLKEFFEHIPLYLQKDDHDLLKDDATPFSDPFGELTFDDGLLIWREQVPISGKPYRTVRWGKDLQVWMVEVREFRSDNKAPDGKDKTIWGQAQIDWFKESVEASDATFKVLVSPIPIVGPDRAQGKIDNHSNQSFQTEGEWLRQYLADQQVLVINGDRHWQYVSVDPKTGLWEFSQGPTSDSHAQGWDQDDLKPEHKFLRVKGGFLTTQVYREAGIPLIKFTHHDVDGKVVHEEVIGSNK